MKRILKNGERLAGEKENTVSGEIKTGREGKKEDRMRRRQKKEK